MKLIICLDEKNGMSFFGRRQSKDRILCSKILDMVGQNVLWMSPYSRELFPSDADNIIVDENYLKAAQRGQYCFVETVDVTPYIPLAEEIVVFRWNRVYPADLYFPMHCAQWKQKTVSEFSGSSHDRITQEVLYR